MASAEFDENSEEKPTVQVESVYRKFTFRGLSVDERRLNNRNSDIRL